MITWEQMPFLGNLEFRVEFSPIDWVKFAEACNSKGLDIRGLNEVRSKNESSHEGEKTNYSFKRNTYTSC